MFGGIGLIKSEFKEMQYQSYLEYVFRHDFQNDNRFSIDYCDDERNLGYDMLIQTFIPIYLQIKRSDYFPQNDHSKIMCKRRELNLNDVGGAYSFQLHVDALDNEYNQHNLLVDLNKNNCYARYIAPLFYEKSVLEKLSYAKESLLYWEPFVYRCLKDYEDLDSFYYWRDYFRNDMSITVLPHKKVFKEVGCVHKYVFNREGYISFHSEPEMLEESGVLLAEFLSEIKTKMLDIGGVDFDTILDTLMNAVKNSIFMGNEGSNEIRIRYENSFLINLFFEIFGETINEDYIKNAFAMKTKRNKIIMYKLLTEYLRTRHGIQTYLVKYS